jgi:hypothetical protein
MNDKALEYPVYEFRPDHILTGEILRYNNGDWIPDDGEYDIAFVCLKQSLVTYFRLPHYNNLLWSWCKNMQWSAFVSGHPNGNAWHYMSRNGEKSWGDNWGRDKHPNTIAGDKAMDFCARKMSCANGRGVEMSVTDKTIDAGLVRDRETKTILTSPEIFKCIYCGNVDWKKEEKR